ncbi:hypothetical protein Tcan_14721, partial [Toxocara canis]
RLKGTISRQRYRFVAPSLIVRYRSLGWNGSEFLIRYHCRGCSWSRISVRSAMIFALILLFYLC